MNCAMLHILHRALFYFYFLIANELPLVFLRCRLVKDIVPKSTVENSLKNSNLTYNSATGEDGGGGLAIDPSSSL